MSNTYARSVAQVTFSDDPIDKLIGLDAHFSRDIAAVGEIAAVPRILEVVCRTTGMGFAAVARVTEDRWIACAVRDEIAFGLEPGGELEVSTTICDEIRRSNELVVIDHVAEDPKFRGHHTPAMYGFQSYISVPLRYPDGRFFGTLCAIDPRPARVNNPEIIGMFSLFADLIGFHLDAQDRIAITEQELSQVRHDADLREQFIAVLGHDLRNPLAAVHAAGKALGKMPLPEPASRMVAVIERSSVRMAGLINNLMDLARGKLAGGLPIEVADVENLGATIEHVVTELSAAFGNRQIAVDVDVTMPVRCDRGRIAQLLSNLVGNALTHGDPDAPVIVRARTAADTFELSVENGGTIPPDHLDRLFHPFARGAARSSPEGLGLGLYIASEIARAHSGTLTATSDGAVTRFTLRLPLAQPVPA